MGKIELEIKKLDSAKGHVTGSRLELSSAMLLT